MVQPFCGLVRRFVWWFWADGFLRLSAHWGPACQPPDLQDFRVLALAVPCPPWPGDSWPVREWYKVALSTFVSDQKRIEVLPLRKEEFNGNRSSLSCDSDLGREHRSLWRSSRRIPEVKPAKSKLAACLLKVSSLHILHSSKESARSSPEAEFSVVISVLLNPEVLE